MQEFNVEIMRDGVVVLERIERETLVEAFDDAGADLGVGDTLISVYVTSPLAALRASAVSKLMSGTALTQDEANLITGSTSN